AHGKAAVEVPVLRLRRDVRALLPLGERLVPPVLRGAPLRVRPHPRDERDAAPVRHPLEAVDARTEVALPLRLAARGRDHIELRLAVLAPRVVALGEEGDAVALRGPGGMRILVAVMGEAARRARARGQQP